MLYARIARSNRPGVDLDRHTTNKRAPRRAPLLNPAIEARSGVHRLEELGIALGAAKLVEQEVDRVHRPHRIEDAAEHVHLLEVLRVGDELLLAGAGARDIDRRERPPVGDLAVEDELGVAGALELFEDDLVHAASGIDQRGGDDRQRAALLDVTGGTE